jgi:hypothetical protein
VTAKTLTRSFAAGELSPELFSRLDLGKFQTGLALCRNFLVLPQGSIKSRAGFEFVRAVKDSNSKTRLIPFTYSSTQTLVIELGASYFRFHTQGATVLNGTVPYELANPYAAADLFDIHYVQSADVLTLVHPSYPPKELRRMGATNWVLNDINFVPTIAAPGAPTLILNNRGGTNPTTASYVTTAIASETKEESLASPAVTASNDLTFAGNYNDVQPATGVGAIRYNVYKLISGLYGYIGQTSGGAFRDQNVTPDVTRTPQLINNPFAIGGILSVPVLNGGVNYASTVLSGGVIFSTTVTNGGSGYTSPPTVTATGGGIGTGATFTAVLGGGPIVSTTVSAPGSGYTSVPTVTATGGGGNGATFTAVLSGGPVNSVTVTNGGAGYTSAPAVLASGGGGTGASFTAVLTGAVVTSITITAGGTGYTSNPTLTLSGGAGSGAAASAGVAANTVTAVTITAAGSGYTSNPTLAITGGGGTGATALAGASTSGVTAVQITTGGSSYTSNPALVFASGGGTGAAALAGATAAVFNQPTLQVNDTGAGSGALVEAVVSGNVITAVLVRQQGSGYVNPTVAILADSGGSGATFDKPALTTANVFPGAVAYYEQRRVFAGSVSKPQNVWATRSGTESNMGYSIPTRSDDSITARIVAREANTIRHLVPLGDLIALTSGGEWRIASSSGGALTPADISVKPQGYTGIGQPQPITTSTSIIYAQARGGRIREMQFSWQLQRYDSIDISILAPHLFDYHSIVDMAYVKAPQQTLWCVREDGVLLGMTYAPEHDVKAWHQHVTAGSFESVAVVAEGSEDILYAIVKRSIAGVPVRFVERQRSRNFTSQTESFCVDAGLTYRGQPATVISGLTHLTGATVSILADGAVVAQQVVQAGGTVTLDGLASVVNIGLPYNCDAQGMPASIDTLQAFGQGAPKNINNAWIRVKDSGAVQLGPSFDKLREYIQRSVADNYGTPPPLVTGEITMNISQKWAQNAQWCLRMANPLPFTLLSIMMEIATGD